MLIPRPRATLAVAAIVAVAVAATACDNNSSTGPPVTQTQIVQRYDALAGQYLAGTGTNPDIGTAIEIFNGAMANGATANAITIYGAAFSRGWLSDVVDLVDSTGTDSVQIVSLWFAGNVTATGQLFFHDGAFTTASFIDSGSAQVSDSVAAVTGSFVEAGDTCSFIPVVNVSPEYPTYDPAGSSCQLIRATFTADSILLPQADTSFTSLYFARIALPTQSVNGSRLQFHAEATFANVVSHVLALPTLARSAIQATRRR